MILALKSIFGYTQILTFDKLGISGHPNHASLPAGIKHLLSSYKPASSAPKLFTLISVPLPSKYLSILAPSLAKFDIHLVDFIHFVEKKLTNGLVAIGLLSPSPPSDIEKLAEKTMPVFVAGFSHYLSALRAMRKHRSQLVWFRWLYVAFSRYMWVNEWDQIAI